MSKKISLKEPAARTIDLKLSEGEVVAIIKHHLGLMSRIEKFFGREAAKRGTKLRDLMALKKSCLDQIDAHGNRASELQALIS